MLHEEHLKSVQILFAHHFVEIDKMVGVTVYKKEWIVVNFTTSCLLYAM